MAKPYLSAPTSWKRTSLEPGVDGEVIVRVGTGSTPSTKRKELWDGDVPWLTPKEITKSDGRLFVSRTERRITEQGLSASGAKLSPPGTVMLTKRAPVGAVVVNAVPMATNQGFLNFSCGPAIRPAYLALWFKANKPYLDAVANGSTYPELYPADLFEFEIAVPPLEYQERVLAVFTSFQAVLALQGSLEQLVLSAEEMATVQKTSVVLRRLRTAVLPHLLSGGIDLSKMEVPPSLRRGTDTDE